LLMSGELLKPIRPGWVITGCQPAPGLPVDEAGKPVLIYTWRKLKPGEQHKPERRP
jgi:hypothetical protein